MWHKDYQTQIQSIIKYSKLCYDRNMVSAAGGNVSCRCDRGIIITGSNKSLGSIDTQSLLLCDGEDGHVISANKGQKPSKELLFHMNVYKCRKSVNCVIHVHPTFATAYTYYQKFLPLFTVSAQLKLKEVPLIAAAAPGSNELAQNISKAVALYSDTSSFLLEKHGILTMGSTMEQCFNLAELIEETAKIAVLLKL